LNGFSEMVPCESLERMTREEAEIMAQLHDLDLRLKSFHFNKSSRVHRS
jgi:hypothetical protein